VFQLTAYEVMGDLTVQLTKADARDTGYSWTHMILEQLPVPSALESDWDKVWLIGQLLCERALASGGQRARE